MSPAGHPAIQHFGAEPMDGRLQLGNTVNPISGSGAQQTREHCAEKTNEVERNGKVGT
jgi:hypothetical protein